MKLREKLDDLGIIMLLPPDRMEAELTAEDAEALELTIKAFRGA